MSPQEIQAAIQSAARRAYRKYGMLSGMEVDDIAQEINLELLTKYDANKQEIGKYINYSARRVCVDAIRRLHGRSNRVTFFDLKDYVPDNRNHYDRVDTAVSIGWIAGDNDRTKQILNSYIIDGSTMAEIAAEHDVTESRVCQIIGDSVVKHRGTCANCGRDKLTLTKTKAYGEICSSCLLATKRESPVEALAVAKERLNTPEAAKRGRKPATATDTAPTTKTTKGRQIIITIPQRLEGLFVGLQTEAENDFRSIDQQILWILSQHREAGR